MPWPRRRLRSRTAWYCRHTTSPSPSRISVPGRTAGLAAAAAPLAAAPLAAAAVPLAAAADDVTVTAGSFLGTGITTSAVTGLPDTSCPAATGAPQSSQKLADEKTTAPQRLQFTLVPVPSSRISERLS